MAGESVWRVRAVHFPAGTFLRGCWNGSGVVRSVPKCRGDCGGIRCARIDVGSGVRTSQHFVKPLRMNFGAQKIRFDENSAEERGVRLDSRY